MAGVQPCVLGDVQQAESLDSLSGQQQQQQQEAQGLQADMEHHNHPPQQELQQQTQAQVTQLDPAAPVAESNHQQPQQAKQPQHMQLCVQIPDDAHACEQPTPSQQPAHMLHSSPENNIGASPVKGKRTRRGALARNPSTRHLLQPQQQQPGQQADGGVETSQPPSSTVQCSADILSSHHPLPLLASKIALNTNHKRFDATTQRHDGAASTPAAEHTHQQLQVTSDQPASSQQAAAAAVAAQTCEACTHDAGPMGGSSMPNGVQPHDAADIAAGDDIQSCGPANFPAVDEASKQAVEQLETAALCHPVQDDTVAEVSTAPSGDHYVDGSSNHTGHTATQQLQATCHVDDTAADMLPSVEAEDQQHTLKDFVSAHLRSRDAQAASPSTSAQQDRQLQQQQNTAPVTEERAVRKTRAASKHGVKARPTRKAAKSRASSAAADHAVADLGGIPTPLDTAAAEDTATAEGGAPAECVDPPQAASVPNDDAPLQEPPAKPAPVTAEDLASTQQVPDTSSKKRSSARRTPSTAVKAVVALKTHTSTPSSVGSASRRRDSDYSYLQFVPRRTTRAQAAHGDTPQLWQDDAEAVAYLPGSCAVQPTPGPAATEQQQQQAQQQPPASASPLLRSKRKKQSNHQPVTVEQHTPQQQQLPAPPPVASTSGRLQAAKSSGSLLPVKGYTGNNGKQVASQKALTAALGNSRSRRSRSAPKQPFGDANGLSSDNALSAAQHTQGALSSHPSTAAGQEQPDSTPSLPAQQQHHHDSLQQLGNSQQPVKKTPGKRTKAQIRAAAAAAAADNEAEPATAAGPLAGQVGSAPLGDVPHKHHSSAADEVAGRAAGKDADGAAPVAAQPAVVKKKHRRKGLRLTAKSKPGGKWRWYYPKQPASDPADETAAATQDKGAAAKKGNKAGPAGVNKPGGVAVRQQEAAAAKKVGGSGKKLMKLSDIGPSPPDHTTALSGGWNAGSNAAVAGGKRKRGWEGAEDKTSTLVISSGMKMNGKRVKKDPALGPPAGSTTKAVAGAAPHRQLSVSLSHLLASRRSTEDGGMGGRGGRHAGLEPVAEMPAALRHPKLKPGVLPWSVPGIRTSSQVLCGLQYIYNHVLRVYAPARATITQHHQQQQQKQQHSSVANEDSKDIGTAAAVHTALKPEPATALKSPRPIAASATALQSTAPSIHRAPTPQTCLTAAATDSLLGAHHESSKMQEHAAADAGATPCTLAAAGTRRSARAMSGLRVKVKFDPSDPGGQTDAGIPTAPRSRSCTPRHNTDDEGLARVPSNDPGVVQHHVRPAVTPITPNTSSAAAATAPVKTLLRKSSSKYRITASGGGDVSVLRLRGFAEQVQVLRDTKHFVKDYKGQLGCSTTCTHLTLPASGADAATPHAATAITSQDAARVVRLLVQVRAEHAKLMLLWVVQKPICTGASCAQCTTRDDVVCSEVTGPHHQHVLCANSHLVAVHYVLCW